MCTADGDDAPKVMFVFLLLPKFSSASSLSANENIARVCTHHSSFVGIAAGDSDGVSVHYTLYLLNHKYLCKMK